MDEPHARSKDPHAPLQGRRILVADDTDSDRYILKTLLERAGAAVALVDDGAPALATIQSGIRFDAAVLDLRLPEMRGTEIAAGFRARGFRGAIIGISSFLTQEIVDLWLAAGCNAILSKEEAFAGGIVTTLATIFPTV